MLFSLTSTLMRTSVRALTFAIAASFFVGTSAYAWPTDYLDQIPVTLVATNAKQTDVNKLVNVLNSSLGYALVMNKIRNGSGTNFYYPLASENIVQQILRQMSLFDLYSQQSLKEKKLNAIDLSVFVTPYSAQVNENFKGVQINELNQQLQNLAKPFMPILQRALPAVQDRVKVDNAQSITTPANIYILRDAQIASLQKRYPVAKFNGTREYATKAAWLAASYTPIVVSSALHVAPPASFDQTHLNTNIIFPAIGLPNMDKVKAINSKYSVEQTLDAINILPFHFSTTAAADTYKLDQPILSDVAVFDDIRFLPDEDHHHFANDAEHDLYEAHKNARALKLEFIKNFSDPHLMDMAVSFGYLPTKPATPTDLNMENLQTDAAWQSLVNDMDFGLVLKGDVKLSPSVFEVDPTSSAFTKMMVKLMKESDKYAHFNEILSMFELRLVFHKLYFSMNRLRVQDPDLDYLNHLYPVGHGDLIPFLKEDPGFVVKNMTLVPEKSVMTLKLSLKPEAFANVHGQLPQSLALLMGTQFCQASYFYENRMLHLGQKSGLRYRACEVNFLNYADFRSFLYGLANNFVMDQAGEGVKGAVGNGASTADQKIDSSLQQITDQVSGIVGSALLSVDKMLLTR